MLRRLRAIRLSWTQVAIVAAASALSTVVIIEVSTRSNGLPYSTLAALRQRVAVHTTPASTVAPVTHTATAPAQAPAPADTAAVSSSLADVPADSTTSVDTGADTSSTTGDDGTGDDTSGSGTTTTSATTTPTATAAHVFVIALRDELPGRVRLRLGRALPRPHASPQGGPAQWLSDARGIRAPGLPRDGERTGAER